MLILPECKLEVCICIPANIRLMSHRVLGNDPQPTSGIHYYTLCRALCKAPIRDFGVGTMDGGFLTFARMGILADTQDPHPFTLTASLWVRPSPLL